MNRLNALLFGAALTLSATAQAHHGWSEYDAGRTLTLTGEVENEAIHAAAERVAHAQPGVLSVVNALEVRSRERTIDAGVVQKLFRPTLKE